ncbi:MAG: hypothetical protein KGH55_03200 [Nanoarchaeota archaeon]|nr:hypothetical protein [Nanoarchaeota archaeon]
MDFQYRTIQTEREILDEVTSKTKLQRQDYLSKRADEIIGMYDAESNPEVVRELMHKTLPG